MGGVKDWRSHGGVELAGGLCRDSGGTGPGRGTGFHQQPPRCVLAAPGCLHGGGEATGVFAAPSSACQPWDGGAGRQQEAPIREAKLILPEGKFPFLYPVGNVNN